MTELASRQRINAELVVFSWIPQRTLCLSHIRASASYTYSYTSLEKVCNKNLETGFSFFTFVRECVFHYFARIKARTQQPLFRATEHPERRL